MTLRCVFCRIIAKDLPAHILFENDEAVVFLDQRPLFVGHCLVVPRRHYETFMDLPRELLEPLFTTAQRIARAVESGLSADGVFIAMNNRISQSVPHLHAHVVPRRKKDGLRGFFWPRRSYSGEEEMAAAAQAIRNAMV